MKAVVQDGAGSVDALHVRDIPVPVVAADGVLVKVHAASVNAADYHVVRGLSIIRVASKLLGQPAPNPVRGVDVAGVVEAVGADVKDLRPGDDVFGVGAGTWAEYAISSERGLVAKPPALSFVEAGAIGAAALTALQGLRDHAHVRPGHRVLIYGAGGGVGTFAVQIANALGAQVTAVTGTRNLDIVRSLAPDQLLDYTSDDVASRAERYDAIVDVAATRPLGELRRLLVPGGVLVCPGAAKRGGWPGVLARVLAIIVRSRVLQQRVIMFVASTRNRQDLEYLKALVESGRVRAAIDRTYPLADARAAVRYAMSGQARAKVVITMR